MLEGNEVNDGAITEGDLENFEKAIDQEERTIDNQEEVKEVAPISEQSSAEIKEVAGETPREKALRLEVTRLKRERRESQANELVRNNKPEPEAETEDDGYDELRAQGYEDAQIQGLEKVIDVIAGKKGYVKKEQNYASMANDTLKDFIGEHQEYSPENDKDDLRWGRFNEIIKSDYNLNGKSQAQLKSIFNKVNRDVVEELGESDEKTEHGKVEAQKAKISSVAGTSGGSSNSEPAKMVNVGNQTVLIGGHPFKGFDEEDLADLI